MGGVRIRFTQAARTHRGSAGWLYVGPDERGRELEIIATEVIDPTGEEILLVVHVMPTALRGRTSDV